MNVPPMIGFWISLAQDESQSLPDTFVPFPWPCHVFPPVKRQGMHRLKRCGDSLAIDPATKGSHPSAATTRVGAALAT